MAVMPDGTVFTNVGWDEAGGNAGGFRDGELVRYAMHTHGWGSSGHESCEPMGFDDSKSKVVMFRLKDLK